MIINDSSVMYRSFGYPLQIKGNKKICQTCVKSKINLLRNAALIFTHKIGHLYKYWQVTQQGNCYNGIACVAYYVNNVIMCYYAIFLCETI